MGAPAIASQAAVILVVDDEPIVLQVVGSILARAGFAVLRAESAIEALRIAEERREPIHLFLCDVVLPHVSGPELAERLAIMHPEARCLLVAGMPDHPEIVRAVSHGVPFLPKPFAAHVLVEKVREVLAAPVPSPHV